MRPPKLAPPKRQNLRGGAWDISQDPTPVSAQENPRSLASDLGFRTFRSGRRILRKVLT